MKIPYQKEIIQLQFPGVSGKQFYELIKQGAIQWKELPSPVLSRLDIVYQRISKTDDPVSNIDFINSCYVQFQELHSYKNLVSERKQKGLILRIGNRRSPKHYRVYINQKNLRFEIEMKGDLIKDFQDLLITSYFEEHEFESKIACQFFKYSFELFSSLNQPSHIDWLAVRIRQYQYRSSLSCQSGLRIDYFNQTDHSLLEEKQHLITFLRLLSYLQKLDYTTKSLTSKFRRYVFKLRDFLDYNGLSTNYYQVKKLKKFFNSTKDNSVIESFSNEYYRMLVTVPEVTVYKSEQNILMVDIWVAEELFHYLHPFLFSDIFKQKLDKHQFHILFEIIKIFSSKQIRKEFNIKQFLDNYPSTLSNQQRKQMKNRFIQSIKLLQQDPKLQDKVLDLSSNRLLHIKDLDSSFSQLALYENINVTFL